MVLLFSALAAAMDSHQQLRQQTALALQHQQAQQALQQQQAQQAQEVLHGAYAEVVALAAAEAAGEAAARAATQAASLQAALEVSLAHLKQVCEDKLLAGELHAVSGFWLLRRLLPRVDGAHVLLGLRAMRRLGYQVGGAGEEGRALLADVCLVGGGGGRAAWERSSVFRCSALHVCLPFWLPSCMYLTLP